VLVRPIEPDETLREIERSAAPAVALARPKPAPGKVVLFHSPKRRQELDSRV